MYRTLSKLESLEKPLLMAIAISGYHKAVQQNEKIIMTYQVGKIIHWLSRTTSGSNSSVGLFYKIYLGPVIKNLVRHPTMAKKFFISFSFFGAEGRLRSFCSSIKV